MELNRTLKRIQYFNRIMVLKEILRIYVKKCFLQWCIRNKNPQEIFFYIKLTAIMALLTFSCILGLYGIATVFNSSTDPLDLVLYSSESQYKLTAAAVVNSLKTPEVVQFSFYLSSEGVDLFEIKKALDEKIARIKYDIQSLNKDILIMNSSYEKMNYIGPYTKIERKVSFLVNFDDNLTFKILSTVRKTCSIDAVSLKYDLFYSKASSEKNVKDKSVMQAFRNGKERAQKLSKTVSDSNIEKEEAHTIPVLFEFKNVTDLSADAIENIERDIKILTEGKAAVHCNIQ